MRPGKCKFRNKRKLNLKQKKLLAKRLIEISMKIDDCVYKNYEIPARDATAYIAEMAMCKPLCTGDARSLQVIEKITRCMNAVLAEQEQNKDIEDIPTEYCHENELVPTYCPSPVYSLPDADKTFLSQAINNTASVFAENIDTINLSDDDDVTANVIQVEVDIHRAMSNLSVQDNDGDDCSQSILVNNEVLVIGDHIYDTVASYKGSSSFNVCNTAMKGNTDVPYKVLTPVNNIQANSLGHMSQQNIANINVIVNKTNIKKSDGKENIINNKLNGKEKQIKQRNVKNPTKKTKKTNKAKKNKANEKKGSQSNNLLNAANNKITNTTNITNNGAMSTINTEERNDNIIKTQVANLNMKNQIVNRTRNIPVTPTTDLLKNTVYNKNVENDLSWLENLRYVREIATEEYITTLNFDENFWNNLHLPQNWDEKDFDY